MARAVLACLQFEVVFGDWARNAATARCMIGDIEGPGLVVLPELAFTGYDFVDRDEAMRFAEDPREGATATLLRGLARESNLHIVAGFAERGDKGPYNAAMLVTPQGETYLYRKIHLFNREQDIFLPGDAPAPVIETAIGRIGMMICFDWFFPECARSMALRGAEVIAHPSNLVLPWCQRAMFARSVENHVFTITANRTGTETRAGRTLTFTGGSQILSPTGETLAAAPESGEHACAARAQLALARDKTAAGRNDLFRDRRPGLYPGMT